MGKGDIKTKKGKRIAGTWGVHRPRTTKSIIPTSTGKKSKEQQKSEEKLAVKAATPSKPKTEKKGLEDLTIIEGIGPKVMEVLSEAGLDSYAKIAETKADKISEILIEANSRYKMFNPETWPEQAKLAAEGKWEELNKLKEELDGGKKK